MTKKMKELAPIAIAFGFAILAPLFVWFDISVLKNMALAEIVIPVCAVSWVLATIYCFWKRGSLHGFSALFAICFLGLCPLVAFAATFPSDCSNAGASCE